MNIQLKNIHISEHLSEETVAFTADLYINNTKVASCKNNGRGGATTCTPYSEKFRTAIQAAEQYCITLDPIPVPMGDEIHNVPNSLENTIDDLVHKFRCDKDLQKFERQKQKDMKTGILIGTDEKYVLYNLHKPLEDIIKYGTNPTQSINIALEQLAKKIKPGERILNTNFPKGVLVPQKLEM